LADRAQHLLLGSAHGTLSPVLGGLATGQVEITRSPLCKVSAVPPRQSDARRDGPTPSSALADRWGKERIPDPMVPHFRQVGKRRSIAPGTVTAWALPPGVTFVSPASRRWLASRQRGRGHETVSNACTLWLPAGELKPQKQSAAHTPFICGSQIPNNTAPLQFAESIAVARVPGCR